jgi:hypothetical protein
MAWVRRMASIRGAEQPRQVHRGGGYGEMAQVASGSPDVLATRRKAQVRAVRSTVARSRPRYYVHRVFSWFELMDRLKFGPRGCSDSDRSGSGHAEGTAGDHRTLAGREYVWN